jgi:predicted nucleic acid-binding protein
MEVDEIYNLACPASPIHYHVLSEFMRVVPEQAVVAWLDEQPADAVWVCAINRAEIELGIALLPEGRRKQGLRLQAETMFDGDFAGRCLPFDGAAASLYARIVAVRTRVGKPISVYGDPKIHPQPESYVGHVNPIGPRSCYDEGKRCAETLFFDYRRQHGMNIKVARIFNTYGPRMHPNDGRVGPTSSCRL